MSQETRSTEQPVPQKRLVLASVIIVAGFLSPLLIPLVTSSSLSTAWKTAISSMLMVGIPEAFTLLGAGILGKEGFHFLKQRLFRYLRRFAPPDQVTPGRYRLGLVLFSIVLLAGWLLPYFAGVIPSYFSYQIHVAIIGDLILITSIFILGGAFWDKLRALYVQRAVAHFPEDKQG